MDGFRKEQTVASRVGPMRAFPVDSDDSIVQEGPTMRAVAMMSSGPSLVEHRLPPTLSKPLPFGLSRPPVGLKPQRSQSAFGVKNEWSGVAPVVSSWDVKSEDLELVPVDYPLERTHREIMDTEASVVASRISVVLASMSIETEFDCKQAKAKCKTGDYVGFRIRLYAGNESGQPVVVEVQRRCGAASSFMCTCRAILLAAEGKDIESFNTSRSRAPPSVKKPLSEMKCLQPEFRKERNVQQETDNALDDIVLMLRSKQIDSNILGIENLASLTDPLKTSPEIALLASKSIVLGDEKHDLREDIRLLTERDIFVVDTVDRPNGASNHVEKLRHYALVVFANSLAMCAKNGCLESAVGEQKWFAEYLIPSLADELRRAPTNACNAHQAACCLTSLLSCSDFAARLFLEQGGSQLLKESNAFGVARHALLAAETERCLKLIAHLLD